MRKTIPGAAALLAALLLAAPACKRAHIGQTIEEAPKLSSVLRMGDPATEKQLVSGFYGIEAKAWRWTSREFSVNLRPPAHSAERGASLQMRLTVPSATIAALGTQTLSPKVGNLALPPQTFSKPGEYAYRSYISPNELKGDSVRIDFSLDKAMPPGDVDKRELGIVVSSIQLDPR